MGFNNDRSRNWMVRDARIKTESTDTMANVLEQAWLTSYPWPTRMIFDRGIEFKAEL